MKRKAVQSSAESHDSTGGISLAISPAKPRKSKAVKDAPPSASLAEIVDSIRKDQYVRRLHYRKVEHDRSDAYAIQSGRAQNFLDRENPGWRDGLDRKGQFKVINEQIERMPDFSFNDPDFGYLPESLSEATRMYKEFTSRMEAMAKMLPVYNSYVAKHAGWGAINLANIVGECGDLSNFANPQKLRKRMGLMAGQRKTRDKEKAVDYGYSPRRRAIMHLLGESLMKQNGDGKYKKIYDERKEYERARAEANGIRVLPAAKIPAAMKKSGEPMSNFISDGHIHKRAMRVMEQKALTDLWVEWTKIHRIATTA